MIWILRIVFSFDDQTIFDILAFFFIWNNLFFNMFIFYQT